MYHGVDFVRNKYNILEYVYGQMDVWEKETKFIDYFGLINMVKDSDKYRNVENV
jgi:hypothetical protein